VACLPEECRPLRSAKKHLTTFLSHCEWCGVGASRKENNLRYNVTRPLLAGQHPHISATASLFCTCQKFRLVKMLEQTCKQIAEAEKERKLQRDWVRIGLKGIPSLFLSIFLFLSKMLA